MYIYGKEIEAVDHFKYLGIDFTNNGSMKNAVNKP